MSDAIKNILQKFLLSGGAITTGCRVGQGDKYGLYQDSSGFCTKGIGHLVRRGPCTADDISSYNSDFPGGQTHDDALKVKAEDVAVAEAAVNNNINVQLTQEQFDALVSFALNEGGATFKGSQLLKDIYAGNCDASTIANDLAQYTRSSSDPYALVNRRNAENTLLMVCITCQNSHHHLFLNDDYGNDDDNDND